MPSIEITQRQADALARGRNITVVPERQPVTGEVVAVAKYNPGVYILHAGWRDISMYDGNLGRQGSYTQLRTCDNRVETLAFSVSGLFPESDYTFIVQGR